MVTNKTSDLGEGKLEFINSEAIEGFTSKAVTADDEANSEIIVRELIQNSIDAGRLTGRDKTKVVFVFERTAQSQIPGLTEYRAAFYAARRLYGSGSVHEQARIERISESLNQADIPVLHIFDNGIGLGQTRMNSLLADGSTDKYGEAAGSAGSYGLGHFTAFPASDMHYILYGGVTYDGVKTMSAHAILASHEMDDKEKGKDGYYITGRHKKKDKAKQKLRYCFPSNSQIPAYVQKNLNHIQSEYTTGSVVSILAFNNFRDDIEDKDAAQLIRIAAAKHFFPAIHRERLEVQVKYNGGKLSLDKETLHEVLQEQREEKRLSKKDSLISGNKAYLAYQTLQQGKHKIIETSSGNIDLYFRDAEPDERTHISLFRSGMYICDRLPRNAPVTYQSYERFNAIILVDPPSTKQEIDEAFHLIRGAEGEKHATIIKDRLSKSERSKFDQLFKDIQQTLQDMAVKDESDSFSPRFMLLESDTEQVSAGRRSGKTPRNRPLTKPLPYTPVPEHIDDSSGEEGVQDPLLPGPGPRPVPPGPQPNLRNPVPSFQRSGRRVDVKVTARRNQHELRISLQPQADTKNAGLRLLLDRGADPSCTDPLPSKFIALRPDATVSDRKISDTAYCKENGYVYEILLGSLRMGQRYPVVVNLQENIPSNAILGIELVSRENKEISL